MPLTSTTDARTTTRRRADLARTLTPAPADPRPIGAPALLVLVAALLVVAGVLWLAEWRDESRATKRAVEVEPCR